MIVYDSEYVHGLMSVTVFCNTALFARDLGDGVSRAKLWGRHTNLVRAELLKELTRDREVTGLSVECMDHSGRRVPVSGAAFVEVWDENGHRKAIPLTLYEHTPITSLDPAIPAGKFGGVTLNCPPCGWPSDTPVMVRVLLHLRSKQGE